MPRCLFCAEELARHPPNMTDSFACTHCGKQLQATLRSRNFFLAVGAAVAVVLRLTILIFNPGSTLEKRISFHLPWRNC